MDWSCDHVRSTVLAPRNIFHFGLCSHYDRSSVTVYQKFSQVHKIMYGG